MKQVYEILEAAQAKLEEGWCAYSFAEDADGNRVRPTEPEAVRWCARGAIQSALGWSGNSHFCPEERNYLTTLNAIVEERGSFAPAGVQIAAFNNVEGQDATVEVFKEAVRREKERVSEVVPA